MSNLERQGEKRETFSSGLAVFFAALSSAVGLGNIWKFPYMVGENGGGAFILVYLICVILVGMPVAISELFIGRASRSNAVESFEKLGAKPGWKVIGYFGFLTSIILMTFYSAVAGWIYRYTFKALTGDFRDVGTMSLDQAGSFVSSEFSGVVGSSLAPLIWQLIFIAVVATIIYAGVKNGIERATKTLMPILFLLIMISAARALTLDGAREGMRFLFTVDFSAIDAGVVLSALGLAFFKLSLGLGVMITYGSYFTKDNNMPATSARVALSDLAVSMLAGIAIFPVVFTFGLEPGEGPGLLFNTIPLVFSRIPLGNVLLVIFFLLSSIAATTAMTSMIAVPVAILTEYKGMKKGHAVLLLSGILFVVGLLVIHPQSLFGDMTVLGLSFFDLFDFISSNVFMPVNGLLIVLFVGYAVSKRHVLDELSNKGALNNTFYLNIYRILIRFVTPILLTIIFLSSIGVLKI